MTDPALRKTSLHDRHVKAGARMVPFTGFEMPVQYTGIVDEHQAVRTACGIFDVSHMGELEMRGEHAAAVVDYLITNDASKLVDGQALYTCCCNEQGTILDDLIVYRAAQDRWLIVCNASNHDKIAAVFEKAAVDHCEFEDRTDATALIALQGPKAFDVLALAGGDAAKLHELKSFHFRDAVVANVRCTVARTGYTGEDGVEIFCAWNDAPALWDQLVELGRPLGLKPAGLGARDTLRLEVAYPLYGHELGLEQTPIAASRGMFVDMNKDFIGKAACARDLANGCPRYLAGLLLESKRAARAHDKIVSGGKEVGEVTSGSLAPSIGIAVALAYVDASLCAPGTKLEIAVAGGKTLPATVVELPFYKNGTARKK
jgi:aminomethyltransferase